MNSITFPGLGLEFEISKIAFSIFGISIYNYAICIVTGIIIAFLLAKLSKEKFDVDFSFAIETVIIAILMGIIGARLYYVLFNLEYYSKNIVEIFNIRSGGLAIYGGLIFGGASILTYCKFRKKDIINFLDFISPFVAIAQFFGRFGNFFNMEAYGYETNSFFRMGLRTSNEYIEVHPVFLYEAIVNLLIFLFLRIMQKNRKFKGEIFLLYCAIYSGFRAILESFRVDSLMLFNFRVSQVLSIIIFIISTIFFVIYCRKINNKEEIKNNM